MRRAAVILLISACLASGLYAASGISIGVNLSYGFNNVSEDFKDEFVSTAYGGYNNGDFSVLHAIGPRIDLTIYPELSIPIGITISSETLITVGYGGSFMGGAFFMGYNQDLRQDFTIGIGWQQDFSPRWGLYADAGAFVSLYRVSVHNKANDKTQAEYIRFEELGLSADVGFYLKNGLTFFKVGVGYSRSLSTNDPSDRVSILVGGGLIFPTS